MSNTPNPANSTTPADLINTLGQKYTQEIAQLSLQASQALQQRMLSGNPAEAAQEAQNMMQPMIKAFTATAEALARDPHGLMQRQLELYQSHLALSASFFEKMMGKDTQPVAVPEKDDRRFAGASWNEGWFDLLKQSYLLTSQWLMHTVEDAKGLDKHTHMQSVFYTRQFMDMLSPSNFLATNPEAISTALATNGESLVNGFRNMVSDIQKGKITTSDDSQFKVGENIAVTPGKVVFRNRLIELIQYAPSPKANGGKVKETPLLISPPWINRFYILDLKPENSFVKYMTDQGYQVFMISWKNPDASYKDVSFEHYITEGLDAATNATLAITGSSACNVIGYCIGGALLASALAVFNAKSKSGKDTRFNSATFFTTLVDYAEAGELGVFIDEEQVSALEKKMQVEGVLSGADMAGTFSALRANDMVWSYVTSNYLMGKQPFPFDILYWNNDSTRMPCAMHSWYLRNLYMKNALVEKNHLNLLGTPVDIAKITQPLYMVSGINDHITPWASCYKGLAQMGSESKRFILSKAGHVAGVVNPPTPEGKPVKRSFWAAEATAAKADLWLSKAQETPDSWWPDYATWLSTRSGKDIAAPKTLGNATYKPLCDAPGTYVVEK